MKKYAVSMSPDGLMLHDILLRQWPRLSVLRLLLLRTFTTRPRQDTRSQTMDSKITIGNNYQILLPMQAVQAATISEKDRDSEGTL